jgi:hypothetical protein
MKKAIDIIKKQIQGNYPDSKWQFRKFDVHIELFEMAYRDLNVEDPRPIALQSSLFVNDTGETAEQTFSVDKTTSDSFAWSLTEGIEVGSEVTVKVPLIADAKASMKLKFESTQTQSTSVDRHWGYSAKIPIPPHSKLETTFSVLEGVVNTPFTATFQARGYIDLEFDISKPGQGADWRTCGGEIAEMIRGGYCVSNPATFQATTSGEFTGNAATTYIVHTKILGASPTVFDSGPAETWSKPVLSSGILADANA